jgi:hypothetical protein
VRSSWWIPAALAALSIVMVGCTAATSPAGAITQTATSARTGPLISPPPVTPPTPPGNNLPAFACKDASGGKATSGTVNVSAVRVGSEIGFDRFVLQFDSQTVPSYTVKRQVKPNFVKGASGQPVTLVGSSGILITVHSASESSTYTGPTDFTHPEFTTLKEAQLLEDFEGTLAWGIGIAAPGCERTFTLTNPTRLVVDFSTTSP